ncbi:Proteophosphoglycan ppg4 [Rhodotorula toruloides ATCC 204091]|uniref:Proteophosphoglycan ppg4 n=1 Tax=Rhodotorula toruloides TaxID=5286 RepID=A0A0K3CPD7_RHOTO|nr:Proteophosphoglycan ppg4 [Rhodotorula toruloides ATCC 204091]PRQ71194.1 Proteophosphoglycan ppg4 [Rhodotorula toruloides]
MESNISPRTASVNPSSSGPSYPSAFSHRHSQHMRRPSRAERYEHLVDAAREVLEKGSRGLEGLGLADGNDGDNAERRRRSLHKAELVDEREWRESVRNLLKVVEGMQDQLSRHDELAKQLKIAQSEYALAASHAEHLEETLRRRESRSSASLAMARAHSGGAETLLSPVPPARRGSSDAANEGSGGGLFGLGLSSDGDGAKGFFRLPSKRKMTPSNASTVSLSAANSTGPPSVASSIAAVSPDPSKASPLVNGSNHSPMQINAEIFSLQTTISSLEHERTALRSTSESLKRNNEMLVVKCAELEKTKDDLMSELENLSVELFSEANTLVAEERRERAKAEDEVARLQAEIVELKKQVDALRQALASRSAPPPSSDPTSPDLPALPPSEPSTPLMAVADGLSAFSASPSRLPTSAEAPLDRPQSIASVNSTGRRKWWSLSRGSSVAPGESAPALPPHPSSSRSSTLPASSGSLQPPAMKRSDSGSSHLSTATTNTFVSARSGTSPLLGTTNDTFDAELTVRAKDKARALDLGIYIPDESSSMARSGSDGGRTAGARTPRTATALHPPADLGVLPSPTSATRPPITDSSTASFASPPLPPLPPPTPQLGGDVTVPIPRPRRAGAAVPRPHAMVVNDTPLASSSAIFASLDPSTVGGPSNSEMSAGDKSPRSPNEERWAAVASNIATGPPDARSSNARGRTTSERSQYQPTSQPPTSLGTAARSLRVDTGSATLAPPTKSPAHRPRSAGSDAERSVPFPQSASSALPTSHGTARAALASGPSSANPSGPSSRPPFLRANSSSSATGCSHSPYDAGSGIPPSTSGSSLSSRSASSSDGHAPNGRALSLDGTKAVEDLESLMASIMQEGWFDAGDVEGGK